MFINESSLNTLRKGRLFFYRNHYVRNNDRNDVLLSGVNYDVIKECTNIIPQVFCRFVTVRFCKIKQTFVMCVLDQIFLDKHYTCFRTEEINYKLCYCWKKKMESIV